jgi:hypothetical protein
MTRLLNVFAGLLVALTPACSFANTLTLHEFGTITQPSPNNRQFVNIFSFVANDGMYNAIMDLDNLTVPAQEPDLTSDAPEAVALTFARPTSQFSMNLDPPRLSLPLPEGEVAKVVLSTGVIFDAKTAGEIPGSTWVSPFVYEGPAIVNVDSTLFDDVGADGMEVPEPSTLFAIGLGFVGLAVGIRYFKSRPKRPVGHGVRIKIQLARQE